MNLFYGFYEDDDDKCKKIYVNKYFEKRKEFKNNNLKYMVLTNRNILGSENFTTKFEKVIKELGGYGIKPSDIVYCYDGRITKKTFSQKELSNLKTLDEISKKTGTTIGVFDYSTLFEYKDIVNADKTIKNKANKIKKQDYSPLEKLLHAYLIVSGLKYKFEDDNDSSSKSRSVYGVLNSDKIVCTGYSEYLRAIIKEIDDKNLKVFTNLIGYKSVEHAKTEYCSHQNNIVYIKDDKYKIDGFYYLDPCWDYKENNSLKHFMTEIKNIKEIGYNMIDWKEAEKAYYKAFHYEGGSHKTKSQDENYTSINFLYTSSVSEYKADFNVEKKLIGLLDKTNKDNFLTDYLISRQDFKDYILLKETMHGLKDSKLSFDKLLEKNAKLVEEDITKTKTFFDSREIFKYLKQHSPHIDIGPIQNALQTVFTARYPDRNKDEISKMVYDTLKQNIVDAKKWYYGNNTLWTECEDLK